MFLRLVLGNGGSSHHIEPALYLQQITRWRGRDAGMSHGQAATQDNVSFCIPADQVTDTVRALHCELGLENVP